MADNGKGKLSTEPYKGVRDFYPEDMFVENYIFETMRNTAESFGYLEYSASILEPAELYEAKTGEEIVNEQTYTFTDRGDRRVTLRPEMTPSVARMVAAKRRELPFPLRWYSIPNLYRYERPQRGRLREHWQLNCDIFGAPGIEADIEIITLASAIMKAFGASDKDFKIEINSKETFGLIPDFCSITEEKGKKLFKLLDKKPKISDEEFAAGIRDIFDNNGNEAERVQNKLAEFGTRFRNGEIGKESSEKVNAVINQIPFKNIEINPFLLRGFDYYTGVIFEVFDISPENNRSLFGGGRYDNLVDIFGVEPVPAVGFGMGDVTIRNFLETHNLMPVYVPSTDLYIATTAPEFISHAQELARKARAQGVSVAVNLLDKKIGDQIKTAEKQSIPFVLVLGEDEMKSKKYKIKELTTGKEMTANEDEIGDKIWSQNIEE